VSSVWGFSIGDDGALYYLVYPSRAIYRMATPTSSPALVCVVARPAEDYRSICVLPGSTSAMLGTTASRLALVTFP
jgi:hypothetical protein